MCLFEPCRQNTNKKGIRYIHMYTDQNIYFTFFKFFKDSFICGWCTQVKVHHSDGVRLSYQVCGAAHTHTTHSLDHIQHCFTGTELICGEIRLFLMTATENDKSSGSQTGLSNVLAMVKVTFRSSLDRI